MRPGQVCPGKSWQCACCRAEFRSFNEARASLPGKVILSESNRCDLAIASMRPGQVCPGKRLTTSAGIRGQRGFNEARASLPGKATAPSTTLAVPPRFNEARASLPGKGATFGVEALRRATLQ